MWEADPNLEWSMPICQGKGMMLSQYHKLYDEKASIVQTTLDVFSTKKENTLILNVSV